MFSRKSAFTLTEVLIVTGVIGLLSGIVITAIRPKENLTAAYSARRIAQAQSIEKAINQMRVSTNPEVVAAVTEIIDSADLVPIQTCKYQASETSGCISLDALVDYDFLPEIPVDEEQSVESSFTGFTMTKTDAVTNPVVVTNPRVPPAGSEIDCESRDAEEECEEEEDPEEEHDLQPINNLIWSGNRQIGVITLSTREVTQLVNLPTLGGNVRLAVNEYDSNVYWTSNYEIYVAPLSNLSDSEEFWSVAPIFPLAFAFNTATRQAYWFNDTYLGSSEPALVNMPVYYPTNADVDAANGMIYWVDGNQNAVSRTRLSDPAAFIEQIVDNSTLNQPYDVYVDTVGDRLYLAKDGIYSVNLDGSDFQVHSTLARARSVVVDSGSDKVYWADFFGNTIYEANLSDIDNTTTILAAGAVNRPVDLVGY